MTYLTVDESGQFRRGEEGVLTAAGVFYGSARNARFCPDG